MPIYEYRCSACGFEKDALQKMSDLPLVECPQCGKSALVKLISAAGFQLKGSGWYATDFKNSGTPKPAATTPKSDGSAPDAAKPDASPGTAASAGSGESKGVDKPATTSTESAKPATPPVTGTGG